MDIILGASIIAAFLAGMVALFAPCCITVLLPAYLASTFRQKKNILKMTFIFFAGISAVLIPIGMGAAVLAEVFPVVGNVNDKGVVGQAKLVQLAEEPAQLIVDIGIHSVPDLRTLRLDV